MGRILDENLETNLPHCEEHTTLKIVLADGVTVFRFASAEVTITESDGEDYLYLGRLIVSEALKMSLTVSLDRLSLQIDNTELELGQALIAVPRALDKCFAVLGTYFKNPKTGEEWHDEKLPGEITTSEINGEVIPINFISELDAGEYGGRNISSAFPDAQNTPQIPTPTGNDLFNPIDNFPPLSRWKLDPLFDEMQSGRHYLPDGLNMIF